MSDKDIEQEIQAKGLTAPRVTPNRINDVISEEYYFSGAVGCGHPYVAIERSSPLHLLTFCVLVLKNGFTVTGESACASQENFDAEIGRKVARENAISKIWMLEGYLLKQELHNNKNLIELLHS